MIKVGLNFSMNAKLRESGDRERKERGRVGGEKRQVRVQLISKFRPARTAQRKLREITAREGPTGVFPAV